MSMTRLHVRENESEEAPAENEERNSTITIFN